MSIRSITAMLLTFGLVPAVDASEKLVRKTYSVADLVIPIEGAPACNLGEGCSKKNSSANPEMLIKILTNSIQPNTWAHNGGSGTVDYFPTGMGLVVNQSAEVHQELAKLFESLRKLQDTQLCFELRLIRVPEFCTERIGVDFNFDAKNEPGDARHQGKPSVRVGIDRDNGDKRDSKTLVMPPMQRTFVLGDVQKRLIETAKNKPVFLSEKQRAAFLEAVQVDPRSTVMQTPKLTTFNGQQASVQVGQTQMFVTGVSTEERNGQKVLVPKNETFYLGTRFDVQGVASADRKSVYMKVKGEMSELLGEAELSPVTTTITPVFEGGAQGKPEPFTQYIQHPNIQKLSVDKSATVPHNGTMLIVVGKTMVQERSEFDPPILSKIPYINRLMRTAGHSKEPYVTVLLVTPRVIVNSEEEEKQAGCLGGGIGALVGSATSCGAKTYILGGLGNGVVYGDCRKTPECTIAWANPAPAQINKVVVKLRNIAAADAATALQTFFSGSQSQPKVVAEPVSNSILINASAEWFPRVVQMIEQLDAQPSQAPATCASATSYCQAKSGPMNLADIVALSTSGVCDDIIALQIETTGAKFTLATEDILFLKKNKVSDAVVMKMQFSRMRNDPMPMPPSPYYPGPTDSPVTRQGLPVPIQGYTLPPSIGSIQPYPSAPMPAYPVTPTTTIAPPSPFPIPPVVATDGMYSRYNDCRTPIVPPIREGEKMPVCENAPTDREILRAVPRGNSNAAEMCRDDIKIVSERIVDEVDPPRFFPLVGMAQLHHCHWKCTVYSTETTPSNGPMPVKLKRRCIEVVYIDKDYLHQCEGPKPSAEKLGKEEPSKAAQEFGEFLIDSAIELIDGVGELLAPDSEVHGDLKYVPISPDSTVKMPKLLDLPDAAPRR